MNTDLISRLVPVIPVSCQVIKHGTDMQDSYLWPCVLLSTVKEGDYVQSLDGKRLATVRKITHIVQSGVPFVSLEMYE